MSEFVVKKGLTPPNTIPPDNWDTPQFCVYFQNEFRRIYEVETRRPLGQLKIYINKRKIQRLFQLEGRSIDIHPNELFKEWIDYLLKGRTVDRFRIWMLGKEEMMVDFLDTRAKSKLESKLGTFDDFEREEAERLRRAEEYFGKNKERMEKGE